MANSRTRQTELNNCKLENPSLLFEALVQCLGKTSERVLGPCVAFGRFGHLLGA